MKPQNFFKDTTGNVVIFQPPNPPLYVAAGLYLLRFLDIPQLTFISTWGVPIVLLYWSYLEITAGASPFRRVLGVAVGLYSLLALIR